MSFQLRNLMKGTGQIVEWSVRDESLHSKAGCWLFRTLLEEDPNLLKQMEWFGHLTSGKTHQDFFANRVTDYSKSTADWSDL
jgi:ribonucleotide reductase beta subunit family protein with ferritin-like domain